MKIVFLALMLSMLPRARAENNALRTLQANGIFSDPLPYCRQYEGQTYVCVALSHAEFVHMLCASEYKEACVFIKS